VTDQDHDAGLAIITFENDEGETIEFAQLIVFELEDMEYAALTPASELGTGEVELFLFRTGMADGQPYYLPVEDEAQAQRVFDIAVELLGGAEGEQ
jgi:hypothetical protein